MNNYFLVLLVLLTKISLGSSSELLLEQKTYGGFSPFKSSSSILVFADGSVWGTQSITCYQNDFKCSPSNKLVQIGKLSSGSISIVKSEISKIVVSKLLDNSPNDPICMDIPVTDYIIYQNKVKGLIGSDMNCHEYRLEFLQGLNEINLLKGFSFLNR